MVIHGILKDIHNRRFARDYIFKVGNCLVMVSSTITGSASTWIAPGKTTKVGAGLGECELRTRFLKEIGDSSSLLEKITKKRRECFRGWAVC
jgi:hypothetical protein